MARRRRRYPADGSAHRLTAGVTTWDGSEPGDRPKAKGGGEYAGTKANAREVATMAEEIKVGNGQSTIRSGKWILKNLPILGRPSRYPQLILMNMYSGLGAREFGYFVRRVSIIFWRNFNVGGDTPGGRGEQSGGGRGEGGKTTWRGWSRLEWTTSKASKRRQARAGVEVEEGKRHGVEGKMDPFWRRFWPGHRWTSRPPLPSSVTLLLVARSCQDPSICSSLPSSVACTSAHH